MRRSIFLLALSLSIFGLASLKGEESEFYKKPTNTDEFWRALQFEILVGRYDLAAQHLEGLLKLNPSEKDILALEAKHTLVPFLRLRNVERWSPDVIAKDELRRKAGKAIDDNARANVERLIQMVTIALKKELSDPVRITKFANNLNATPEEIAFAKKELIRSGVDAIPVLLDLLQQNPSAELRSAILEVLPLFDVSSVPPLVAALDANNLNLRMDLLKMLRSRRDYLSLISRVETNIIPNLWFYSTPANGHTRELRKLAMDMLIGLLSRHPDVNRDTERRLPQWQLANIARSFLNHVAKFSAQGPVQVWKWENGKPVSSSISISDAEEYYGLRYAKWALAIQSDYAEAQKVFLTLALDKHFARSTADKPLAQASPALYAALAAAPYDLIASLLETAMHEGRVSMAVALIQVFGERTEVRAVRTSEKPYGGTAASPALRSAILQRGLDSTHRRIQFAALDALLKTPSPQGFDRTGQIVKLLGAALTNDPDGAVKPKVMIGDLDRARGEALAGIVRQAGFEVEVARTGRDVIRRLQERTDFDLLLVDHHLPSPLLPDFLSQIRADFRTKAVPLMVIASPNQATTAHPITLLARLAAIVAAEEHLEFILAEKRDPSDASLNKVSLRFSNRLTRLKQLVESANIVVSADVIDRLEYLVYLTTPPKSMELTDELERTMLYLPVTERLARFAALRKPERGHLDADEPPFSFSREKTPGLAELVARYEAGKKNEVIDLANEYFRVLQYGQLDKDGKYVQDPIPAVAIRYPEIEGRLRHLTRYYALTRVIPEVFSEFAFREELRDFVTIQEPKALEAEKKSNARVALEWLRKMALGELKDYPWIIAELPIRGALHRPELSMLAIDCVERMSTKEAQQDLASVVIGDLDGPIRAKAADALIHHMQQRGRMISLAQREQLLRAVTTEKTPEVLSRLLALKGILSPDGKEIGARLIGYTPPLPGAPKEEDPKKMP